MPLGLEKNRVEIRAINLDIKKEFEDEKQRITKHLEKTKDSLAKNGLVCIEHVGSTAIGIEAKPILDILIVINPYEYFDSFDLLSSWFRHELFKIGYNLIAWDLGQKWLFLSRQDKQGLITHHVHIVENKSKRHVDYILFRDFMIKNKDFARKYESFKKDLAKKYPDDRLTYKNIKSEYVEKTMDTIRKMQGIENI